MNLAQVRLRGIGLCEVAVLHRFSRVRIALDPETCDEPNALRIRLGKGMRRAAADGNNRRIHGVTIGPKRISLLGPMFLF